jgi:hydrogenase-4 component B
MMIALFVALFLCAAGTFASCALIGSAGRLAGFALLAAGGGCAFASGLAELRRPVAIFAGSMELHTALRLDATSAFFVLLLGAVALFVGIFGAGKRTADECRTGRTASASACAILFASLLACTANDVLLFIFAWESLALAFFWAIAFSGTDPEAPRAAYLTVVLTHVAGAGIIGSLLWLSHLAGTFHVDAATRAASQLSPEARSAVAVLLLFGFGAKFGMLPLQAWMPYGYRAAPSIVAALMAGGALNVGFYGVVRFIVNLPGTPIWFAILAMALGALSAVFGITWACAQRDMRTLAAYSSVENAGVVLAALGVAVAGRISSNGMLAGFGIAAALVQITAHTVSKSTLFLAIATINDRSGTLSLDRLGGLSRKMPVVTAVALLCGMSLAALPPLAGFVGEWMVLESLMQAFRTGSVALEVSFAISGALIGIAAGIAIVTFTKLLGIGLLGAPRSGEAATATQTRSGLQLLGLVLGACCIVAGGVLAQWELQLYGPVIDGFARAPATGGIAGTFPLVQPSFSGFSSASPLGLGCVIVGFTLLFWIFTRLIRRPGPAGAQVWTSGEPYSAWTQYTATGFSNPTRAILDVWMRTVRETSGESAQSATYRSFIRPFFGIPFYRTISSWTVVAASLVRRTQSGVIAAYLSYILVFVIVLLVLYPSIRHW